MWFYPIFGHCKYHGEYIIFISYSYCSPKLSERATHRRNTVNVSPWQQLHLHTVRTAEVAIPARDGGGYFWHGGGTAEAIFGMAEASFGTAEVIFGTAEVIFDRAEASFWYGGG